MAKRSYKPEEIVGKLRQVDVLHSQGATMADAVNHSGPQRRHRKLLGQLVHHKRLHRRSRGREADHALALIHGRVRARSGRRVGGGAMTFPSRVRGRSS